MNNCHLKFSGRNSYKWWQKKTGIKCIIVSIMFLIWFVIIVELGYSIFGNTDVKTLIKVCIYLQEKQDLFFRVTRYIFKFSHRN
jgi:hypothetical protein